MAVTYRTALKNARLQAVIDDIGAAGLLKIGTAGMSTLLAQITLGASAFGAPSGGAMSLSGTPLSDTVADATGAAAAATICKADGTVVISGLTVGAVGSGANIELNSTAIQANTEVRIDSGTITHP
jgi:hypothetical protein